MKTHKEEVRDIAAKGIENLDLLFEVYGKSRPEFNGGSSDVYLDTVFLLEQWRTSPFLQTIAKLAKYFDPKENT